MSAPIGSSGPSMISHPLSNVKPEEEKKSNINPKAAQQKPIPLVNQGAVRNAGVVKKIFVEITGLIEWQTNKAIGFKPMERRKKDDSNLKAISAISDEGRIGVLTSRDGVPVSLHISSGILEKLLAKGANLVVVEKNPGQIFLQPNVALGGISGDKYRTMIEPVLTV